MNKILNNYFLLVVKEDLKCLSLTFFYYMICEIKVTLLAMVYINLCIKVCLKA